jgi:hypothetical protein
MHTSSNQVPFFLRTLHQPTRKSCPFWKGRHVSCLCAFGLVVLISGTVLELPPRPRQRSHTPWSPPWPTNHWDLSLRWATIALYLYISHGTYHTLPCIIVICTLVVWLFLDCKLAMGRGLFYSSVSITALGVVHSTQQLLNKCLWD